jgi:hypothetical protein
MPLGTHENTGAEGRVFHLCPLTFFIRVRVRVRARGPYPVAG